MKRAVSRNGELRTQHKKQLDASGISIEFVLSLAKRGWVRSGKEGLEFPYFNPDGSFSGFVRTRLDRVLKSGQKYAQEAGSGCWLYAPGGTDSQDAGKSLLIVEGEKKTLSAYQRLYADMDVVGIGGVWNWTAGGTKHRRRLLSEFNGIPLDRRRVYLCFDSDTARKKQCLQAERELAEQLIKRKARVRILELDEREKGLDDWFVRWENDGLDWRDEVERLCKNSVIMRDSLDFESMYDRVYTSTQMMTSSFPIPKFFWGDMTEDGEGTGLIGEGMVTILHGQANLGKTYLTMQLACAITRGEKVLGYPAGPAGTKVLMLQGELPPGLFARGRLRPVQRYLREPLPETLSFLNWSFNLAESSKYKEAFESYRWRGFERLGELCDEHNPGVLFIDPLQAYNNLVEASNDQARELLKRLKQFAIRRNLGIVIVDHDRKNLTGGASDLRGAGNKNDLADTTIGLRAVEDHRSLVSLHFDKVRYINAPRPGAVVLERSMYVDDDGVSKSSPFFTRSKEYTKMYRRGRLDDTQ